jgi:hypothetical protein
VLIGAGGVAFMDVRCALLRRLGALSHLFVREIFVAAATRLFQEQQKTTSAQAASATAGKHARN